MLRALEVSAFCSTRRIQREKVGWRGHGCRQRNIVLWVREQDTALEK